MIKSFATVEIIEEDKMFLRVEMMDTQYSNPYDQEKQIKMIEVKSKGNMFVAVWISSKKIQKGDIIVVEHDGTKIMKICYKDDFEKKRRSKFLQSIMG